MDETVRKLVSPEACGPAGASNPVGRLVDHVTARHGLALGQAPPTGQGQVFTGSADELGAFSSAEIGSMHQAPLSFLTSLLARAAPCTGRHAPAHGYAAPSLPAHAASSPAASAPELAHVWQGLGAGQRSHAHALPPMHGFPHAVQAVMPPPGQAVFGAQAPVQAGPAPSSPVAAQSAPSQSPAELTEAQRQAARLASALAGDPAMAHSELLGFMQGVAQGSVSLPELEGGATGGLSADASAAVAAADAKLSALWREALATKDPAAAEALMGQITSQVAALQGAQAAHAAAVAEAGGGAAPDVPVHDDFANLSTAARDRLMEAWAGAAAAEAGELPVDEEQEAAAGSRAGPPASSASGLEAVLPSHTEGELSYTFQHGTTSAFAALDAESAMQAGERALQVGRVHDAVAAFEAAVARDATDSEAWHRLGTAHAQGENDPAAIVCFKRAVSADPYNTAALLSLGVSLMNERRRNDALHVLHAWLDHSMQFAGTDLASLAQDVTLEGLSPPTPSPAGLASDQQVDVAFQREVMKVSGAIARVGSNTEQAWPHTP